MHFLLTLLNLYLSLGPSTGIMLGFASIYGCGDWHTHLDMSPGVSDLRPSLYPLVSRIFRKVVLWWEGPCPTSKCKNKDAATAWVDRSRFCRTRPRLIIPQTLVFFIILHNYFWIERDSFCHIRSCSVCSLLLVRLCSILLKCLMICVLGESFLNRFSFSERQDRTHYSVGFWLRWVGPLLKQSWVIRVAGPNTVFPISILRK